MPKSTFGSRASEPRVTHYSPSTSFQVAEDIMPIAQLKANLSDTVRGLQERPRPIVVTLNGKPAAVIMSPREYDRLTYRARFIAAVQAGLNDLNAGRFIDDDELGRRIEQRYKARKPGRRK